MYVLLLNIGEFLSGTTEIALTRVSLNHMTFGK